MTKGKQSIEKTTIAIITNIQQNRNKSKIGSKEETTKHNKTY
jgi:hypothetical protein